MELLKKNSFQFREGSIIDNRHKCLEILYTEQDTNKINSVLDGNFFLLTLAPLDEILCSSYAIELSVSPL